MIAAWRLQRTAQCAKCPWIKGVDPHQIPGGYCETRHRALAGTIAAPGEIPDLAAPLRVMACHETHDAHCVGWLAHQAGPGNNIGLRLRLLTCSNAEAIRLRGEQHKTFEETLPSA